jgi:hypothetical protein
MNWFRFAAMVALVCAMAACGSQSGDGDQTSDGVPPAAGQAADGADGAGVAIPAYNLGDVEVNTRIVLQAATRSLTPTVQYEELGTLREPVAVANATVKQPHPAEFWITSGMESRTSYRSQDTVYLKVEVTAEGTAEPLAVKSYVVSKDDIHRKLQTIDINLMEHLNPLPKSVLVQSTLTIAWFPDTAPMEVSAENPDLSKAQVQTKLSNPLRINFE